MTSKPAMKGRNPWTARPLALAMMLVVLVLSGGPLHATPGEEFTVKAAGVALRAQPRDSANPVLTLTPEHRLVEFERRGDWVRVGVFRQVGGFGWVRAEDLVPLPRPVVPVVSGPPPNPQPRVPSFLLEIDGTPAIQFRGTCVLVGAGGTETTAELAGSIPRSYSFDAATASCWVRKWDDFGRMSTRLYRGDRIVAELATSGPYNLIWIRSDGPWGPARAQLRGGLATNSNVKP